MKATHWLQQGDLNFLITNALPRKWLSRIVRGISRSEQPCVSALALSVWRLFADVDVSDAVTSEFKSVHACFTRRLRRGARPITADPSTLVSPCDAIVGACGRVRGDTLLQAKGSEYTLAELLADRVLAEKFHDGCYVTLRLTSGMYHRFHAPRDCIVEHVSYFPGELWNVNPPTLRRVAKLFCKNERAVLQLRDKESAQLFTLVPVGAVLVGSIRLNFMDVAFDQAYRGPHAVPCHASFVRGEEMGWFEHGSTMIVLAPADCQLLPHVVTGSTIRMGTGLMSIPPRQVGCIDQDDRAT